MVIIEPVAVAPVDDVATLAVTAVLRGWLLVVDMIIAQAWKVTPSSSVNTKFWKPMVAPETKPKV